jgi:hypothetical protein
MRRLFRIIIPAGALVLTVLAPTTGQAGGAPALAWSPSTNGSFDYGAVSPGQTASQTFTLTNSGGSASGMLTAALSGSTALTKTADGCTGTSLGPGKSCAVTVQYAPTTAGQTDTGTLAASGKKVAASASITLTGSGAGTSGPPDQGDPAKMTAVLSGYVCSGTIVWRGLIQGDGQANTVTITETLPIVEVRVKSHSIAELVSAVFSGNFLSATVTISQGVENYAWSVCQPGDTTTTSTRTTT